MQPIDLSLPSLPAPTQGPRTPSALELVRREARRLHRAATRGPLLDALPALRRLHAAGVLPHRPLMQLHRERAELQRKHFLRTLAVEMGFADWESFHTALPGLPPEALDHYHLGRLGPWGSGPNAWFSTEAEARAHATAQGGRVLRLGSQAVVVRDDGPAAQPPP